ncbi:hypothetical protein vseg_013445 [Gypsophila vaccaria]
MEVANAVGSIFGQTFEVDEFDLVPRSDYLRLRVCMCMGEPLIPGFFLMCEFGYLLWIQFRYEEVFKYCIRCGKVGHKGVHCTERTDDIEESVANGLHRMRSRGFTIFQTERIHTMFNLDLRALPSTTKYVTSKIRLGNTEGLYVPADFYDELIVNFDLGTTSGGRIHPGTRFSASNPPFSSAVFGQIPTGNNFGGERGNNHQVQGDSIMQNGHIGNTSNGHTVGLELGLGVIGSGMNSSEAPQGPLKIMSLHPEDPYNGNMGHGQATEVFNQEQHFQRAINIRVEENINLARMVDDERGYNQTFGSLDGTPINQILGGGQQGWHLSNNTGHGQLGHYGEGTSRGPSRGDTVDRNRQMAQVTARNYMGGNRIGTGGWWDSEGSDNVDVGGGTVAGNLSEQSPDARSGQREADTPTEHSSSTDSTAGFVDAREDCSTDAEPVINSNLPGKDAMDTDSATAKTVTATANTLEPGNEDDTRDMETDTSNAGGYGSRSAGGNRKAYSDEVAIENSWVRCATARYEMGLGIEGKRKANSDPKLALVPETCGINRGEAMAYLQNLDKKRCTNSYWTDLRQQGGSSQRSGFRMHLKEEETVVLSDESSCGDNFEVAGVSKPPSSQ